MILYASMVYMIDSTTVEVINLTTKESGGAINSCMVNVLFITHVLETKISMINEDAGD
jgi:hypothetical protein